jgi:arylsulfatase A-like enzyme
LQNNDNSPISNHQTSYFGNTHLNPNPSHNPNFQNSSFIPNPQNNPHSENYSYQHPQFSSQSTNPTMSYGVQMSNNGIQLNDQEPKTPPFCTQGVFLI